MDMGMDMDMDDGVRMGAVCACACAARVHVCRRPHTPTKDGYLRIVMERQCSAVQRCAKCKGVPSAEAQTLMMAWVWVECTVRATRTCITGVELVQTPSGEEAEEQKEVTAFHHSCTGRWLQQLQ